MRFEVCGAFMGQAVECADERPIHLWAASEVPIASATIVRNGEDWRSIEPGERIVDWRLGDAASSSTDCYYARIERSDGWLGWASPVWVNRE